VVERGVSIGSDVAAPQPSNESEMNEDDEAEAETNDICRPGKDATDRVNDVYEAKRAAPD
jgi:hypothetical protein